LQISAQIGQCIGQRLDKVWYEFRESQFDCMEQK